jgi:hypothetical protein
MKSTTPKSKITAYPALLYSIVNNCACSIYGAGNFFPNRLICFFLLSPDVNYLLDILNQKKHRLEAVRTEG